MKQLSPLDLTALLRPLDERQPAGAFDEENELFQSVDHEMVKLGGLQARTIDWRFVDEGAREYLSNHCKHFRMAGHLMTAHLQTNSWRGWAEAAAVLAGMVQKYWETGHPKPGATGYPGKRRLVTRYLEQLGDALPRLQSKGYAKDFHKAGQQALDSLQASTPLTLLEVAQLSSLERKLRQQAESAGAPELAGESLDRYGVEETLEEAFFVPLQVNPGNERENRRSLLSAADIINHQDAYDPTGYLLRRFALWAHLTQAPSPRKERRTELMAVPLDVANSYDKALTANNIGPALLQRVERSVSSSPYWLRGSFLSAAIAHKLEMPRVAEAIRQAAERFVTRLPALTALEFADGRPFVDDDTQAWLSGAGQDTATGDGLEYPALREELSAQLDAAGVEPMLRSLESLQQRKKDARHACHVMAIAAELLASRGLTWLAEGLYARAHNLMNTASTRVWEPELYELLARHASADEERKN
ncbi:type VI secretion system protein VasJ [Pseudomonas japonica]|uniref:Type VI secretion system protein VasJ n=1 Tax=Pseudomonas japonica TaxID=256466 RepID=A0A239CMR9_9PSED|nr:type VI secretion system protein VasJ [Pseudomonas japonica]